MDSNDARRAALSLATRAGGGAVMLKVGLVAVVLFFIALFTIGPIVALAPTAGNAQPGDGSGGGPVSGDKRELAQQIVASGKVYPLASDIDNVQQIRDIANGSMPPNCDIDIRILQVLVMMLPRYETIGVSDINRHCTGSLAGAGQFSSHWIDPENNGTAAVDFFALNGAAVNGGDSQSIALMHWLDGFAPDGARIGQVQCNAETFNTLRPFEDDCNHVHFDLAFAPGPLKK